MKNMLDKISYNTPVILSYTILSFIVLIISMLFPDFHRAIFVLDGDNFSLLNPSDILSLVGYSVGHANFEHFMGNFTLMLLVGPMLENKYGSKNMLGMFIMTALITGVLHVLFFSGGVLGASGNVFMVIILSSFVDMKKDGKIPLTLVLTFFLFMGKEVIGTFTPSNISHFGHIMGGLAGGFFGWSIHRNN